MKEQTIHFVGGLNRLNRRMQNRRGSAHYDFSYLSVFINVNAILPILRLGYGLSRMQLVTNCYQFDYIPNNLSNFPLRAKYLCFFSGSFSKTSSLGRGI